MPEMMDSRPGPPDHEQHDLLLVSRHADDDLDAQERAAAMALVAGCAACRELVEDLRAISRAMAFDPVPARPRDFRISAHDAARLRGSLLQRLLRRLAFPELALLRPLAGGAMALGVVLIAIGSVVPSPMVPTSDADTLLLRSTPGPQESFVSQEYALGEDDAAASKSSAPAVDVDPAHDAEADTTVDDGPALMTLPEGVADPTAEADAAAEVNATADHGAVPEVVDDPAADPAARAASDAAVTDDAAVAPASPGSDAQAPPGDEPRAESDDTAGSAVASASPDVRIIAVAAGMVLAFLGFLVALVLMLARRHGDPLLR